MTSTAAAKTLEERPPIDLAYRLAWRSRRARAGSHRSALSGAGGRFRDLATLLALPDPRRIDLRQSLRDPFDTLYVRRFEQTSAVSVAMLLDVSRSMLFEGRSNKFSLAAQLAAAIAASARRVGDTFALAAADSAIRDDLSFPATRSRANEADMTRRVRRFIPTRSGAGGLAAAAAALGPRRSLVFVVTDAFMSEADTEALFEALAPHDVMPIVVTDTGDLDSLPSWGLIFLTDLESGRRRLFAMRPSLKAAWIEKRAANRRRFNRIATRFGREPFEVIDAIDWDRLGTHLMSGA